MTIKLPPIKAKPADLADWIEVRTLAAPDGIFRITRIKRYWDTHRESEDSDPEGLRAREEDTDYDGVSGNDDDVFLDAITDELNDRALVLKESYPFKFEGNTFVLKEDFATNNGGYAYLFCLLISNCKEGDIFDGSWLPAIDHRVRDLFQACSTLAAAGNVTGCAISFGWPRPTNNPPFLTKLKTVYDKIGEGVPVDSPKPGASPHVKDEAIDIIAWRPRPDNAAGTEYLLGQVASGDNWEYKSIKGGAIDYFHNTWFSSPPSSPAQASIFIPYAVHPQGEGSRRDRIALLTHMYGRVFDRLILPLILELGIRLADDVDQGLTIERRNDFPHVIAWVECQLESLRAAGPGSL